MASHLYTHGTLLTVDPTRRIILDGAMLVTGNRIAAIDKTTDILAANGGGDIPQTDLHHRIVIPGLINTHIHLIQSLMRGLGEDLALHKWASCTIWPLEVSYRDQDGAIAARISAAEMLRSGTTCFLEPMLPSTPRNKFADIVHAVGETGMRACLGKLVKIPRTDDPNAGIPDDRDGQASEMTVAKALAAHEELHGSYNDRVHVWMAPDTPRGQDARGFDAVGRACIEHGVRLTVHCAEARQDTAMIAEHYDGCSPAEFLQKVHSLGEHVVLGHMVHLQEQDYKLLRDTKTSVAHNPTSNAKLADGIAPVPKLLAEGVNVCIGSDGAPCNNAHDLFRDMHLTGVIHKALHEDASLLPAEQVLEMATINAATALGLEKEIGSLEVGKKADFVVCGYGGLHAAPFDPMQLGDEHGGISPATVVVHSLTGQDVEMVVVDGRVVVEEGGKLVTVDEERVKREAKEAIARIRKRAGVKAEGLKMGWRYV